MNIEGFEYTRHITADGRRVTALFWPGHPSSGFPAFVAWPWGGVGFVKATGWGISVHNG